MKRGEIHMDENNVNGFDNMDDEEGTTVLASPGVSAYGGAQGAAPTNMTTPDQGGNQFGQQMGNQMNDQFGSQMNGQFGQQMGNQMNDQFGGQANNQYDQQYGSQANGQYDQQYGGQVNGQYDQQQYGGQMNGQYGQQQYGGQMNGQYGQQQYGGQMNGQYGQQQYGGQMNGQYGQPYGAQMGGNGNPFGKPANKFSFSLDEFKNVKSFNDFIKNTKLMIISGAALALIIIFIVIIIVAASGGRGAGSVDTIGDQLAKAVQTGNENRVYKLTNKKALNAVTKDVGETKKETLEDISEVLEDYTDDIEDEVGKIKKIEVKDVKKNYEGKSDIKDIEKKYKRNYDLQLDISGYVSAKADITIEGKDGTADGTIYYYAVKIGNKWYLDHENGFSVSVDSGDWDY